MQAQEHFTKVRYFKLAGYQKQIYRITMLGGSHLEAVSYITVAAGCSDAANLALSLVSLTRGTINTLSLILTFEPRVQCHSLALSPMA